MNDDLTSLKNPPGWGVTDALDVVIGRIPPRLSTVVDYTYNPDATELIEVNVFAVARGVPIPAEAEAVFHASGSKARVIAQLLAWLEREGL